jgi:hypothetical protein
MILKESTHPRIPCQPTFPFRALLRALVFMSACACVLPAISRAEGCSLTTEHIRLEQTYGAQLPDCRAYEQVSPVEKNLNDAIGHAGLTQVSPDGERITFGSISAFPEIPGASEFPTYLSKRAADGSGWVTQGLLPATKGPRGEEGENGINILGLTEDLSLAVLREGLNGYLYNTNDREISPFPFSDEGFVDASSDDSDILFGSTRSLSPKEGSIEGAPNLYELNKGRLRLVAPEAVAGADVVRERRPTSYTEHTISADGSRVFYTSLKPGLSEHRIFMRESSGEPLQISSGEAEWRAATPDGSTVLYTEGSGLQEGIVGGLYRWTWHKGEAAPHTTQIAEMSANVLGTLGISNDGTYVYFVAEGKLASRNSEGREPVLGEANLYEWYEGEPKKYKYIATLSRFAASDTDNWRTYSFSEAADPADGLRSSQVTPSGHALLFTSSLPLTGYDNQNYIEIFLYNADEVELTCVSCNPSGSPATADAYLSHPVIKYAVEPPRRARPFAMHNLSEDGQRVFFQTAEALVSKDENGLSDVYEWENGNLYLISSGQGNNPAYLGDSSADGRDVFFFTRQPLVAQDQDNNVDLYDAREGGGIAAQNEVPPPPCVGEQCHGAVAPLPSFDTPASATYLGAGNLVPQSPPAPASNPNPKPKSTSKSKPKCRRGYARNRHGKCVKAKTSRRRR